MMVRLRQLYRVDDVLLNESSLGEGEERGHGRQLRLALHLQPDRQFTAAEPSKEAPRGSTACRLPSEVGRDPHRSRPQDPDRARAARGPRGLLVPAARAQARARPPRPRTSWRPAGARRDRARSADAQSAEGARRTSTPATRRSCASARRSRRPSTCPACWCSSTRPRPAPASASRRSRPATAF